MNEVEFKKHLKDLAHGHHHPEEHDWAPAAGETAKKTSRPAAKRAAAKPSSKRK